MAEITWNNRKIGDGHPVYIIAEMSANHAGSLERAKQIVHKAKESGADCIKIQTYTPDTLTIDCHNPYFEVSNGTWQGENLYSLYGKAYTPWEWQKEIMEEAKRVGIDFLSTPFDRTAVDFLEDLGVDFYKIGSFEIVDLPFLSYVASKGKPIILSTGMASLEEIREAVETVYQTGNRQLVILKCSSAYPALPQDMNLVTIRDMKERFGLPVGLSDHSMGFMSAVTSVALGGSVIEKHFCLGREIENPDASFSMTPDEFKTMAEEVRLTQQALGTVFYGISSQERPSMVFRRSLFAVQEIPAGAALTPENIRSIRPGYGIKPKYLPDVLGMKTDRALKRGEPLSFDALEKGCILFLTNNENTYDLYEWPLAQGERVHVIRNRITLDMVKGLQPAMAISFNYRHIVPGEVLAYLKNRVLNLHTSLLPYNRGSSPNFFSFLCDTPKGVTIHLMDQGLDTGDVLLQKELFFDESKETFASTYDKLMEEIKGLFREHWQELKAGKITPVRQEGTGSLHRMKELERIRQETPFTWDTVIADFKAARKRR